MARESMRPTCEKGNSIVNNGDTYRHPAFGVVTMSVVSGGGSGTHLFGSDVPHLERIRIAVKRAKNVRSLATDWVHTEGAPLVEFDMTHAQFAQFVTSSGNGSGTPVTLSFFDNKMIPSIEKIESVNDLLRHEIKDAAKKRIEEISAGVDRLSALIESGKTPKKELESICKSLRHSVQALPGSVAFVVQMAEEALEEATSSAKIEVEGFISNKINKLGLHAAQNLGLVAPQNDSKPDVITNAADSLIKDDL